MEITYIANVRMPTEKAHGIQIMKACEALASLGHKVTLVVPTRHTPIKDDPFTYYQVKRNFVIVRRPTIDTTRFGTLGFVTESIVFSISARLSLPKGDIVYGRDEIVLAVLTLLGVCNLVWESHDGAWNQWTQYLVPRLKRLVVVTLGAREWYESHGVVGAHILAIPNGIDLSTFAYPESKGEARRRLNLPLDTRIALYIGRLDGWKGVETLLAASELLPEDVKVAIIGGEQQQVAELSSRYPKIQFLGYHPYRELANNQAAADVLVVPNTAKDTISVRFTSPLKLFAHMASTRPIVASDLPSIREVIGNDAYLVAPDNPRALAEGIQLALTDSDSEAKARRARSRLDTLTWEHRARLLEDFLASAI